jgi:hypothetical protein
MLVVYGVVRADHPGVTTKGVHGATTYAVRAGGLAAIVSECSGELLARRRDVEAHLGVLEAALAGGDVLPFRFGTVVDDDLHMRQVLERASVRYAGLLDRVGGRVQMTLKAVRDDDEAVRTAVGTDDGLRRAAARWRGSDVWSERVALGERVAAAVDRLSRQDAERIATSLHAVADELSVEPVTPPVVASLALLVPPDRLTVVDRAVAALHDEMGDRLSFDYAGPMPAYSFVI